MSKLKTPYILSLDKHGQDAIDEQLGHLIDQTVCICYTTTNEEINGIKAGSRNNYDPQISVQANLEGNVKTGRYRVLIDDNTYSYFYNDSVWFLCQDEGKRAVIYFK
jgi:hypothetical protein|tara:strand:+ start:249 stop:569 length:321 start_codon:yes stop_codon:yes gene_type:complete